MLSPVATFHKTLIYVCVTGKGLTVESDLEHFMTRKGSLEERVVLLDKLQHTLELVAVLVQYLSLPRTLLGTTARYGI